MKNKITDKMIDELKKAAHLEGTEVGETWSSLACMWEYHRDYLSADFVDMLEKEIVNSYKDLKKNYKVIEKERTYTRKEMRLERKE